MEKNLMLISTHESLYININDAASVIKKYVACTMLGVYPNEENLFKVKEAISKYNIKGIITRGTWAVYIQQNIDIPVFPFKQDAYDLLQNIKILIQKGYSQIGSLSYVPSLVSDYHFGQIDIYHFGSVSCYLAHIRNNEEASYVLNRMSSIYHVNVMFGDVEGMDVAKKYKMDTFPFQLSSRFLISTIDDAKNIIHRIEHEKAHTEYIQTLTNIISECSVFTNAGGEITFYNLKADNVFHIREMKYETIEQMIGLPGDELLREQANRLVKINDKNFMMNVMPVILQEQENYSFLLSDTQNIEHVEISIRRQNHANGLVAKHHFEDIIFKDERTRTLITMAKYYAVSDGTVLITGESGTGKEIYANAIHNESLRKNEPFVAINCATFNENLIESELFGYEKGAFTGALSSGKKGLFELAHKGTLFLDEVGELPVSMQAKLLRVLQEHEVRHLGGSKIIPVDVRIIAATNKNLRQMVYDGTFREDLYFRLSLLELSLLPLRERPEDIIPLFKAFINQLIVKSGKKIFWTQDSVFSPLLDYTWPGNIRELENVAMRAVLLTESVQLEQSFIKELVAMAAHSTQPASTAAADFKVQMQPDLNILECRYIEYLIKKFHNDKDEVCKYLNISRATLWRKLAYLRQNE